MVFVKRIPNFYSGTSEKMIFRARRLRKNMTNAELVLWEQLRNRRLDSYKFRRQHPTKRFILDFYCPKVKLAIEVDGGIHMNPIQHEYDINREAELKKEGIRVIRFTNEQVMNDVSNVVSEIRKTLSRSQ